MKESEYKKIYKIILKQLKDGLDDKYEGEEDAEAKISMNQAAKEYLLSSKENEKKLVYRIMGGYENQIKSVNVPVTIDTMKHMLQRPDITVLAARNLVITMKMEDMITKMNAELNNQKTTE